MNKCVNLHYSFSYWVHDNKNLRLPWLIFRNVHNFMLSLSSLYTVTTEGVADSWSNPAVSFRMHSDVKVSLWNLKYSSKSCSGQIVQVQQNGNLWTTWFFVCKSDVNCQFYFIIFRVFLRTFGLIQKKVPMNQKANQHYFLMQQFFLKRTSSSVTILWTWTLWQLHFCLFWGLCNRNCREPP